MDYEQDELSDWEVAREQELRILDALTDGNCRTGEQPPEQTARAIRVTLHRLQLLADRPRLRHRLGYGRVTTKAPFADSRRPTDPRTGNRPDCRSYRRDQDANYAAGML